MTKYAIIETGGKQYKVREGDVVEVELLGIENGPVTFDKVLFIQDVSDSQVGLPLLSNYKVNAEVVDTTKGPKVVIFKYKRVKGYRRLIGHRQKYSLVKINEIAVA
jgi:large subunit ribosomal protein L21